MLLNESIIEDSGLEWFGRLGYAVGLVPQLAPGEYAKGTLIQPFASGHLRCASVPKGRGEEARATVRQFRRVQISA
jgi:hypothetical protein